MEEIMVYELHNPLDGNFINDSDKNISSESLNEVGYNEKLELDID